MPSGKTVLQIAEENSSESKKAIECKAKAELLFGISASASAFGLIAIWVAIISIMYDIVGECFKDNQDINLIKAAIFLPALMCFIVSVCF